MWIRRICAENAILRIDFEPICIIAKLASITEIIYIDINKREVLHVFYLSTFIVSPVAMLVYGIDMKSGLNEILFYVVFTLPVIRYFLLQFLDNCSSMKRSEKLKKYVEKELSGIRVSGRTEEDKLGYTLRNI